MKATCAICHESFEAQRSSARYCSPRCRQRAQRAGLSKPRKRIESVKIIPASAPKPLSRPSVDDVAQLACSASGLEASFRHASRRADYRLRPMCERMADAIAAALDREGLR